jgi:curli production assembly/transport component CsgG
VETLLGSRVKHGADGGKEMKKAFIVIVLGIIPLVLGCAATSTNLKGRYNTEGAVRNWTGASKELMSLPKPEEKIVVSVWKIPDETGQYKEAVNATDLSRAVTQGATHMLIKALRDSGWFTVVEREGWPNLAQEIKIREEMKRLGVTGVNGGLHALKVPQYMISGALTEYENHPISGGGGAAYRGFGFSTRAKAASVATDIRLTDIETGVIVDAVSTYKRILSEEVDFSVFRFLKIDHLLEVEVGYTANEPTQVCVREALEKSVIDLIVDGVKAGYWKPAKEEDLKFFSDYGAPKEVTTKKGISPEGKAPASAVVFGKEINN